MKKIIYLLISTVLFVTSAFADQNSKNQICIDSVSEIESNYDLIYAIPGGIDGQVQINFDERGLRRFERVSDTIMIDAERFSAVSRKTVFPAYGYDHFRFAGIHIMAKTNRDVHDGVDVFSASLSNQNDSVELFETDNFVIYFKDFSSVEIPYTDRDSWLLVHGNDQSVRWSHHTFLFTGSDLRFDEEMELNIRFETNFDHSEDGERNSVIGFFDNLASGSRIDTCIYFLFK